jgi:glutamine amidotransferase
MSKHITVVDYDSGNLLSVARALEHCGASVEISADVAAVERAQALILPGVGAFADGMGSLRARGLVTAIERFAATGRPLLGICLGMQMLATMSEEFGEHPGLGLIPGRVIPVPGTETDGEPQKVPFIGWASLLRPDECDWGSSPLQRTSPGSDVYLVHSYYFVPQSPVHVLAQYVYGGHRITAAVRSGNIVGLQFHPEKSGRVGLEILDCFASGAGLPDPP